ncbi:MAG TPA: helix-hairpin-helix domain-containing protein [Tepidisphaeraceae bacterium]|jgi:DNA uptake protein ComE-like DNA-binding protein|nr:helix-hairpin-helix domain-containing protein [Tepidisphaeraceae bacterium]
MMCPTRTTSLHGTRLRSRRGSILIITMVVVFAIASMVLSLGRWSRAESLTAANGVAAMQAVAVQRGAEQHVLALLATQRDSLATLSESEFANVPVGAGYFWIVRPTFGDTTLPQYGLLDESAKVNLNTADQRTLESVPNMTPELAAAIIDWRDEDDTLSANGAESQEYQAASAAYVAKNAPFETVEELLLVKGMTPALLYGTSATGSVITDSAQASVSGTYGLFDRFTVWSSRPNTAADGTARVRINGRGNQDALEKLLQEKLGQLRGSEIVRATRRGNSRDLFDFANRAGLKASELALIEDQITTADPAQPLKGQINVFQAPREVLGAVLNLSTDDVDELVARRDAERAKSPTSIAWVYDALEGRAVGLGDRIAGQGRQFSADIVTATANGRAFRHVRIVIDASDDTAPRIVYRRELSDGGWPLDPAILTSLRDGRGLNGGGFASSFQGSMQ